MKISNVRSVLAAVVFALVSIAGLGGDAKASLVASFGALSIGQTGGVSCNATGCGIIFGSPGVADPAPGIGWDGTTGLFSNEIFFTVGTSISTAANLALSSDLLLKELAIYATADSDPAPGNVDQTTAVNLGLVQAMVTSIAGTNSLEVAAALAPGNYYIQIKGVVDPVTSTGAFYNQQLTVSAVPLPPALILFATALFGMIGVGRIRRRRAAAAA